MTITSRFTGLIFILALNNSLHSSYRLNLNPQLTIDGNNTAALFYHTTQQYAQAYKALFKWAETENLYATPEGRMFIVKWVEYLAKFSDGTAEVSIKDKGVTKAPRLENAFKKEDLYLLLYEKALKTRDKEAIIFLTSKCGVNVNSTTMEARTPLHLIGEQTKVSAAEMLACLRACGLASKGTTIAHINSWNSEGKTPLHIATERLVKNHVGELHPEKYFQAIKASKALDLNPEVSEIDHIKNFKDAREKGAKDQFEWAQVYLKGGALNIPDINGKKASDNLKNCECKAEKDFCKKAYDLIIAAETAPSNITVQPMVVQSSAAQAKE